MRVYLAIAAGTALGGYCRFLAALAFVEGLGLGAPVATAFVNVTGSFLIGLFATLTEPDGRWFVGSTPRQAVMTGFLGGYTTFSLLSLETLELLQTGVIAAAILNLGGSLAAALLAVWIGHVLALRINRLPA
jgi:fluoride exporter